MMVFTVHCIYCLYCNVSGLVVLLLNKFDLIWTCTIRYCHGKAVALDRWGGKWNHLSMMHIGYWLLTVPKFIVIGLLIDWLSMVLRLHHNYFTSYSRKCSHMFLGHSVDVLSHSTLCHTPVSCRNGSIYQFFKAWWLSSHFSFPIGPIRQQWLSSIGKGVTEYWIGLLWTKSSQEPVCKLLGVLKSQVCF